MMNEINYYAVEAKCGHVGRKNCIVITFPIVAESKKEAARITRQLPRVKHDHKDAIISVREITKDEYLLIKESNSSDLYLQCKSKQEQRMFCVDLDERIIKDTCYKENEGKNSRMERILYKKKKYLSWLTGDQYCLNSTLYK